MHPVRPRCSVTHRPIHSPGACAVEASRQRNFHRDRKDSDRYKVANCIQAQPVFYGFARVAHGKVISVSVLKGRAVGPCQPGASPLLAQRGVHRAAGQGGVPAGATARPANPAFRHDNCFMIHERKDVFPMMRPIVVAGIAVAAVAAAGVGAYLGVRHAIGPASGIASTVAADPALAAGEPSPAPVTAPEPEPAETEVVVEPVAADPPPAPRPVARREPPAPRPAAAPPEPARRTPPAAARPVAPEPSLRPQPVAAPVATPPEPEPAPAPVPAPRRPAGDRARAATADPALSRPPASRSWTDGRGPGGRRARRRRGAPSRHAHRSPAPASSMRAPPVPPSHRVPGRRSTRSRSPPTR